MDIETSPTTAARPAPNRWRRWPFGPVRTMLIVSLALSLVFLAVPSLDLWFSGLFYDPEFGFAASHVPLFQWLRTFAAWLLWIIVIACLVSLLAKLAMPQRPSLIPVRTSVFLLSTVILSTGLLVNGILKSFWGRPRPTTVDGFGGDLPFVGVWQITDHCDRNCSFVSGEASSAIWLLALALVVPVAWRQRVAIVALVLAIIFSINRVAFGGHFLSDVLISWSLTLLVVTVAYHYLFVQPPRLLSDLEATMTRAGFAIRSLFGRPQPTADRSPDPRPNPEP